jgi:hypothetical protein
MGTIVRAIGSGIGLQAFGAKHVSLRVALPSGSCNPPMLFTNGAYQRGTIAPALQVGPIHLNRVPWPESALSVGWCAYGAEHAARSSWSWLFDPAVGAQLLAVVGRFERRQRVRPAHGPVVDSGSLSALYLNSSCSQCSA